MVESLKFRPLESGSAEAGLEVIGPDVLLAGWYNENASLKQAWAAGLLRVCE